MRILLAEAPLVAAFIAVGLRDLGHTVDVAITPREAAALGTGARYDALIVGSTASDPGGVTVLRELRRAGAAAPALLLTAGEVPPPPGLGTCKTLKKPLALADLLDGLTALLKAQAS